MSWNDESDRDNARADREVSELIERTRVGDGSAVEALIARYRTRLEQLIRAMRRQQDAAVSMSDILQDASERVFLHIRSFQGQSRGEFERLLWKIVRSLVVSEARAVKVRGHIQGAVPVSREELKGNSKLAYSRTASKEIGAKQDWARILQCLARLPPDQGRAVYRRHVLDYSLAETARELGRDQPAVSSLLWRGLRALAAQLGGAAPGDEAVLAPHLDRALGDYYDRVDRGEAMEMEAFVAEYPECADALRAVLELAVRIGDDDAEDE